MAAGGNDRLSGLSDDLLRRVLRFLPVREGALTSALSRRWRPLWLSCGVWRSGSTLNLVGRAYEDEDDNLHALYSDEACRRFYARRDAFVSAAHEALDAAYKAADADGESPIRALTICVEANEARKIHNFLHRDEDYKHHDVLAGLLSHPAARGVEELRIAAVDSVDGKPMSFESSKYEAFANIHGLGIYPLGLGSLPSETLRVLELTNCSSLKPPAARTSFPRLTSLRLRHCNVPLNELQRIIDAAPLLAFIHLEAILLELDEEARSNNTEGISPPPPGKGELRSLSFPAATALMLDKCSLKEEGTMEIYAPMLRHFRYQGVVRHISLKPPPPQLARAELTLLEHGYTRHRDPHAARRSFWETVQGLSHAKEMKLRVRHLEEIGVTNETRKAKLLPELRSLEHLELVGGYTPTGKTAAVVIANLLRCSPSLRDLQIKLSTAHEDKNKSIYYGFDFLKRKYPSQFEESVRRSKRRRSQSMVAVDEDGGVNYDGVSDLPGLRGRSFECLRRSLKRVGLQFQREKTNCFGVRLIKFFAENAKVLETMCVDAGNERIHEHMNHKIEKWIASSSERRKNSKDATRIQVLPLAR
ncbi:hypothetical protein CFC21_010319 [Triticum aestivum]|uniref:F-box domain-containing protein n=2 Tax=Triticum aestivum TaxID=4565 RepID=A0A3B5ZP07_WHEAT|nr:hypothetical protein CFC21_010319 [Triticum aestivum]